MHPLIMTSLPSLHVQMLWLPQKLTSAKPIQPSQLYIPIRAQSFLLKLSTNDKKWLLTTDRPTIINTVRPTYSSTSKIDNFTRSLFLNYTGTKPVSVEFRNQFSTTAVTTVGVDNSTAHNVYSCSCRNIDINVEDLILQRKRELQVKVKMLSTTKRKWISAQDVRPASQAIGSVGVLVICAFCAVMIGTDIINFLLKMKVRKESKKRKWVTRLDSCTY